MDFKKRINNKELLRLIIVFGTMAWCLRVKIQPRLFVWFPHDYDCLCGNVNHFQMVAAALARRRNDEVPCGRRPIKQNRSRNNLMKPKVILSHNGACGDRSHSLTLMFLLLGVCCNSSGAWANDREEFIVAEHQAFVLKPPVSTRIDGPLPWVWYAPTLGRRHPNRDEQWMIDRLHAAGIALAGIDVSDRKSVV